MPKLDHILLIISLMLLSFSYGTASVTWKIFPYQQITEAKLALTAWYDVIFKGDERLIDALPVGVKRLADSEVDDNTGAGEATDQEPNDELILMTGGPFQLVDHCPDHGCVAWLMDRDGTVVHSWSFDPKVLWPDTAMFSGRVEPARFYPIGLQLSDNGDLVVSFQAFDVYPYSVGIAKFDRDGKVLWSRTDFSHHWLTVDSRGMIFVPALETAEGPHDIGETHLDLDCEKIGWYDDLLRILSPQGEVVRDYPILELLARSDFAGALSATVNPCDPTHLNAIELVPDRLANAVNGFATGDLLISLRELNMVALLDKEGGTVKHAVVGRTVAQHSPKFLPDGQVLVFDNQGGAKNLGGSRIVRIDLQSGDLEVVFPKPDDKQWLPFFTETAGHLDVSGDGTRALVSSTDQGKVLEIDVSSGEVLWTYHNWHDIADYVRTHDLDIDSQSALFATYGAYYVPRPDYLR